MKAMTVEFYIKSLLVVCDEMLDTLQKARLDSKEIDRWKQVVNSYKQHPPTTIVYSDVDKYL